jgi:hypothetical protein
VLEANRDKEDRVLGNVPVFIGIDVSKARLDVSVRPLGSRESFANDEVGVRTLVKGLRDLHPALIVLEATGGVERRVVRALASEELPVVVVNPRQVRDFLPKLPVSWPRLIGSTLKSWPALEKPCGLSFGLCRMFVAKSCGLWLHGGARLPK